MATGNYYTAPVYSYTDSTTTDVTTACNNRRVALGYPAGWVCSGNPSQGGAVCQCQPCCTISYTECVGNRTYFYYTDPCCGTSCATQSYPGC